MPKGLQELPRETATMIGEGIFLADTFSMNSVLYAGKETPNGKC